MEDARPREEDEPDSDEPSDSGDPDGDAAEGVGEPDVRAREANRRIVRDILLRLLDSGLLGGEAEELVDRAARRDGLVP